MYGGKDNRAARLGGAVGHQRAISSNKVFAVILPIPSVLLRPSSAIPASTLNFTGCRLRLMGWPPASMPCLNPAQCTVGHRRCLEKGTTLGRAAKEPPQISKPLSVDPAEGAETE